MKNLIVIIISLFSINSINAQSRTEINIPDIPGYVTLKCDFHMHTLFSDGRVWPTIRVYEAWRDGLDVIAISDHINYRWPLFKEYINIDDHNAPYNEAKLTAERLGMTLINAVEINRGMPPGHFNILFAEDVNELADEDFFSALRKAKKQGAYIQWNHPGYGQKGTPKWFDVHDRLYEEGLLHGIEVYNHHTFFSEAVEWAKEKNLVITGNSDVHFLADMIHEKESHRPVTLVFAKDNSPESVKEAVFDGTTAVYFENTIVGKTKLLKQIFNASVKVVDLPMIVENYKRFIQFKNNSDVDYELELLGKIEGVLFPETIKLSSNRITLQTMKIFNDSLITAPSITVKYIVKNLQSISGEQVIVEFEFIKKEPVIEIKLNKTHYPEVKY